jgi:hypothetical protein
MVEKITQSEAEQRIARSLTTYVTLDEQLTNLTKQSSKIRKQRSKVEQQIDVLAQALNLSNHKITCNAKTFSIDYNQPRAALSQKLLRDTLTDYFKHHLSVSNPEKYTTQFLELLESKKQKLASNREKSLKIKYS